MAGLAVDELMPSYNMLTFKETVKQQKVAEPHRRVCLLAPLLVW